MVCALSYMGRGITAIREVFDRVEGKPGQALEHSGRLTLEELVAASFASLPATEGQDKGEIATPHAGNGEEARSRGA
jgi:hypothetical protein